MRRLEAAEARSLQKELSRTRTERMHRQLTLGALLLKSGLADAAGTDFDLIQGGLLVLLDAYRLSPATARAEWLRRLHQGAERETFRADEACAP